MPSLSHRAIKAPIKRISLAILFFGWVAGCSSTIDVKRVHALEDAKIDGVPFSLPLPSAYVTPTVINEYSASPKLKDEDRKRSLNFDLVFTYDKPDPNHRYVFNVDPEFLSSIGVVAELNATGGMTSLDETVTSQVPELVKTIGSFVQVLTGPSISAAFDAGKINPIATMRADTGAMCAQVPTPGHCFFEQSFIDSLEKYESPDRTVSQNFSRFEAEYLIPERQSSGLEPRDFFEGLIAYQISKIAPPDCAPGGTRKSECSFWDAFTASPDDETLSDLQSDGSVIWNNLAPGGRLTNAQSRAISVATLSELLEIDPDAFRWRSLLAIEADIADAKKCLALAAQGVLYKAAGSESVCIDDDSIKFPGTPPQDDLELISAYISRLEQQRAIILGGYEQWLLRGKIADTLEDILECRGTCPEQVNINTGEDIVIQLQNSIAAIDKVLADLRSSLKPPPKKKADEPTYAKGEAQMFYGKAGATFPETLCAKDRKDESADYVVLVEVNEQPAIADGPALEAKVCKP